MARNLTPERAIQIAARIRALDLQGKNIAEIGRETGHNRDLIQRVLHGKGVFCRLDMSYLDNAPSVSDKAAREMSLRSWPDDEEQTTEEIYAAAEAIRTLRPREPQGFEYRELVGVPATTFMGLERRGVQT